MRKIWYSLEGLFKGYRFGSEEPLFPLTDVHGRRNYHKEGTTLVRCGVLPQNMTRKELEATPIEVIVILIRVNYLYAENSSPYREDLREHFYGVAQAWIDYGTKHFSVLKHWKKKSVKEIGQLVRRELNFTAYDRHGKLYESEEKGFPCDCKDEVEKAFFSCHSPGCSSRHEYVPLS